MICYKVSRSLGIIAKIQHYIPRRLLLQIYNSLIVPYLTYGICAWGNCSSNYGEKILLLQKRAFRLIYFGKSKELAVPFFLKSNCLPLPSLFFSRNTAISYELTDSAHQLTSLTNLLKRLRFLIVILDLAQMNLFIVRVGVRIWNSIPPSIKLFSRTKYRKVIKSLLEDLLQSEDDYAEVPRLIELFYSLSSLPSYLFSSVIMIF